MKTLAIRLDDDLHAQLSVIAQLSELTVTDAIRQAIEQWIESKRSAPELTSRAESVLDDIERDAAQRRSAIATLFGDSAQPELKTIEGGEPPRSRRSPRGKEGPSAES
jgi:predicted transcriptional regulator